jgi:hypothetical protein
MLVIGGVFDNSDNILMVSFIVEVIHGLSLGCFLTEHMGR